MKYISVDNLSPNLYFSEPVFLDNKYILLSPDVPVDEALIERLKKWKIEKVSTEGTFIGKSQYATVSDKETTEFNLEQDVKNQAAKEEVVKFYFELLTFCKNTFTDYLQKNQINLESVSDKIKQTIEHIKQHRDLILKFNELKYPTDNYIYNHHVNTTLLSLSIGYILKLPPHKLIELGIAAFLHDIGMIKLPSHLYLNNKPLDPQEKKTMMAHTVLGYKILRSLSIPENIALVAIEHHEKLDGSGYPRGLKSENISLYGRIIAVACSFDGCTSERPFKEAMDGHKGIVDLIKAKKNTYDENVLKALIFSISLYPIGTYVLLSDNAKGVVVKTNPSNPKCPVVRILVDKSGKQLADMVLVQTATESGISIWRALEENEKPKITGAKNQSGT
jgi:HD-GYP domain-containing protein (c-di-GMP phosphodiesterase class II)